MPMMMMVMICVLIYFASFAFILFFTKNMNPKHVITTFIIINTILFFAYIINEYNRKGIVPFLLFDQISPFMFSMLTISIFMNDKIKKIFHNAAALLSFGMFVAMLASVLEAYLGSFNHDANMLYVLDTLLHLNFSLFGIYLFVSKTVKINIKSLINSLIFLYSVILFATTCNFLFKTNFFGMGYYCNYGIYMIRIFENFWATFFAYILGVALVLMLGYEYLTLLKLLSKNHNIKYSNDTIESN